MEELREQTKRIYCFDNFQVDTQKRQLLRDGQQISVGMKAFDLLLVLLESNGREISKEELLEKVWNEQFVEEANLTVHIAALRKALGERKDEARYILTIPRHGYRFVADLIEPGNGFIVEEHTVSQITIEHETESETQRKGERKISGGSKVFSSTLFLSFSKIAAVALIGLLLIAGVYFWRAKKTNPPFEKVKLTRLTNRGNVQVAALSASGNFIAYVLSEAEGNSLWVRQVGAANDKCILPPVKAEFWGLTFKPDGTEIYYNLFSSNKTDVEVFRIPTLGGVAQKLPDIIAFEVSFSPDGKRFAYILPDSGSNHNYLFIANADGSNPQSVSRKPQPNTFVFDGAFTAWSPDGETIACLVNHYEDGANYREIVGINVKDGTEKPLGARRWRTVSAFEWTKDGSGLIVSGSEQTAVKNQVWFVSQTGNEIRPVINDLNNYSSINMHSDGNSFLALQTATINKIHIGDANGGEDSFKEIVSEVGTLNPFVWTPDKKIIFQSAADGSTNLWMIDADGANRRQLTLNAKAEELGMCITPDGKYIVFVSGRAEKSNLWRVEKDGSNLTQLTNGESDGYPNCTRDGKSVIYQRGIYSQPKLWKISIDGSQPQQLTDYRAKWGAISNDGSRISFLQMLEGKWRFGFVSANGGDVLQRLDVPEVLKENEIRWSPDDHSLFFIGASGSVGNIWSLPLDGGKPQPVTNFKSYYLEDFAWSPDSTKLAVARSSIISDVVLIERAD